VPDHGNEFGLRLVGSLGGLARGALRRQSVDKPLDLREQIVGLKTRLNCRGGRPVKSR
jgi:hypothetical protein